MNIVCAIIVKKGKVFAAKRKPDKSNPNLWEFPGGKVEEGEDFYVAITREIHEEFNLHIMPTGRFEPSEVYDGASGITLIPICCELKGGNMSLTDHSEFAWLNPKEVDKKSWSPADRKLLEAVKLYLDPRKAFKV